MFIRTFEMLVLLALTGMSLGPNLHAQNLNIPPNAQVLSLTPNEEVSTGQSSYTLSATFDVPSPDELTIIILARSDEHQALATIGAMVIAPFTTGSFKVVVDVNYGALNPGVYEILLRAQKDSELEESPTQSANIQITVVHRVSQKSAHYCYCEDDTHIHHDEDELLEDLVVYALVYATVISVDIIEDSCALKKDKANTSTLPFLLTLLCVSLFVKRAMQPTVAEHKLTKCSQV